MKIINKFRIFVSFFLVAIVETVFAAPPSAGFISIDPALLFANPGITQDINFKDDLGNTYVDQTQWIQKNTFSVGIGIRSYQNKQWQINTSLRYVHAPSLQMQGQIWQLKSPLFDDLAYGFHVRSDLFLVDNIISLTHYCVQPGIILGLGLSSNTTGQFHEQPLTEGAAVSLQSVDGARITQTAYELGAVLDYPINKTVIELAYRYINAGTGHLKPFSLQNTNDLLSTGTLKYHLLSIGIRAYYEL